MAGFPCRRLPLTSADKASYVIRAGMRFVDGLLAHFERRSAGIGIPSGGRRPLPRPALAR
eukprot:CAMPEP_0182606384 /NCGR_PEP_ID=MMETSP1330-20130603/1252_1 /TAXON_ID=464278 /ORGANISM="Picochlorum sp., Strain RCC944" /LENGTH=59 /DNA_ID=CAMNT_0024824689 /DNA_START=135 /DNA_END=314 /DNA_ORIENTATION=+